MKDDPIFRVCENYEYWVCKNCELNVWYQERVCPKCGKHVSTGMRYLDMSGGPKEGIWASYKLVTSKNGPKYCCTHEMYYVHSKHGCPHYLVTIDKGVGVRCIFCKREWWGF